MSDLRAVMQAQRACRRFDPDGKVLDSDIEQMLQLAAHAPSAENTQPWSFVVVRAEENRKLLADWWTETWNAGGGDFVRQNLEDKALVADLEFGFNKGGFAAAPVVVVVCADTDRVAEIYAPSSIYPAVQNLLLAAADLGYGSCLTTGLTTFGVDRVRELLELPPNLIPMAAVYVGRPVKKLSPPRRRPVSEVTYREKFGTAW
ncbi:nitroreductase family protein [Mycobacterium avium]|jgi:nitroreductase|uniref:NADPH nitroreductase n=2 Tax=Mycobacterium avium TaxID=1764 RepID=A0A0H2ZS61_MYCA1|nr:nitroreductase family protein [Mycobacterium avium]ABK64458.1 NADPH nitroreductase [Mycobacterium avium 104]KDP07013.1 NADH-ubiquinone oxidoreductase subunit 3 [Mycobacterium avium subsp. hominissuis 101]MBZ4517820.1 nitroreductase family protein [Mycobacterium avium subsp. hominissuis]MBZ4527689.1 nitroreductase family protein [Mycobacterium avium subsp. hominissuis]MBZ4546898.1 nitroreductase family protein [Mycobacterium avium subsp. hominissuis]